MTSPASVVDLASVRRRLAAHEATRVVMARLRDALARLEATEAELDRPMEEIMKRKTHPAILDRAERRLAGLTKAKAEAESRFAASMARILAERRTIATELLRQYRAIGRVVAP